MINAGIVLNSAKDIEIKATGKISIQANQSVNMKSSGGDVTLEGMNLTAKAQMNFSAQGAVEAEIKSSAQTSVKGAIVMIN
ncbi:MAG: hypothetical protein IPL65_21545 [Lewinellaceae bacterium]|nr:hypothetical protein [Lewinellaceae bacterium]